MAKRKEQRPVRQPGPVKSTQSKPSRWLRIGLDTPAAIARMAGGMLALSFTVPDEEMAEMPWFQSSLQRLDPALSVWFAFELLRARDSYQALAIVRLQRKRGLLFLGSPSPNRVCADRGTQASWQIPNGHQHPVLCGCDPGSDRCRQAGCHRKQEKPRQYAHFGVGQHVDSAVLQKSARNGSRSTDSSERSGSPVGVAWITVWSWLLGDLDEIRHACIWCVAMKGVPRSSRRLVPAPNATNQNQE